MYRRSRNTARYLQVLGHDDFYYDDRDHGDTLMPDNRTRPSYIVLQRGLSMQSWIKGRSNGTGKISNPYEIMWMLSELCNQLQILHSMGYVHRDVKPDNVLWLKACFTNLMYLPIDKYSHALTLNHHKPICNLAIRGSYQINEHG